MSWRRLVAAVAVAAAMLGCEEAPVGSPIVAVPGEPIVDCRAMAETCRSVVADAALNAPPGTFAVRIQVACKPGCTPANGEADVAVQYSDGSTSTWTMGWAGAVPAPMPPDPVAPGAALPVPPGCVGVPDEWCQELATSAWQSSTGRPGVMSITVTCDGVCGASGAGSTSIRRADGTTEDISFAY